MIDRPAVRCRLVRRCIPAEPAFREHFADELCKVIEGIVHELVSKKERPGGKPGPVREVKISETANGRTFRARPPPLS